MGTQEEEEAEKHTTDESLMLLRSSHMINTVYLKVLVTGSWTNYLCDTYSKTQCH